MLIITEFSFEDGHNKTCGLDPYTFSATSAEEHAQCASWDQRSLPPNPTAALLVPEIRLEQQDNLMRSDSFVLPVVQLDVSCSCSPARHRMDNMHNSVTSSTTELCGIVPLSQVFLCMATNETVRAFTSPCHFCDLHTRFSVAVVYSEQKLKKSCIMIRPSGYCCLCSAHFFRMRGRDVSITCDSWISGVPERFQFRCPNQFSPVFRGYFTSHDESATPLSHTSYAPNQIMPAREDEFQISIHHSASSLDSSVLRKISSNPRDCNIFFAHLTKTRANEKAGGACFPGQLWIVSTSLILACTQGRMGTHPIFIAPLHPHVKDGEYLNPLIERLADELFKLVPRQRVFSVFAPDFITPIFVDAWHRRTSIPACNIPYYHAKLTYVTNETLVNRSTTVHPEFLYELRLAVEADIPEIAPLCFGFAQKSAPFFLTEEESLVEATLMVQNGQCWIHRINRYGEPSEIASIVNVGRDSGPVAAITKVYTNPDWRRRGCAERLVRQVCKTLLATKESVILYVAHDNVPANGVYRRVGFAGLDSDSGLVEGVDSWLEIGFVRDLVELGYW